MTERQEINDLINAAQKLITPEVSLKRSNHIHNISQSQLISEVTGVRSALYLQNGSNHLFFKCAGDGDLLALLNIICRNKSTRQV